jgi:hypothetical protein
MKTIVYIEDGAIEATVWAEKHVAAGVARYATPEEIADYERNFARDDARIAALEKIAKADHCANRSYPTGECPSCIAKAVL